MAIGDEDQPLRVNIDLGIERELSSPQGIGAVLLGGEAGLLCALSGAGGSSGQAPTLNQAAAWQHDR